MAGDTLGAVPVNQLNEEVLFATGGSVDLGRREIEELKERASRNHRRRVRLCAHLDVGDPVHEMLIVHAKGAYVRPHKHLTKAESLHVIDGSCQLVLFDDSGNVTQVVEMGNYSSGKAFYHRMSEPRYHTLLITSEYLVFHETANGPFVPEDTAFPDWAPEEFDQAAVKKYKADLVEAVERLLRRQGTN